VNRELASARNDVATAKQDVPEVQVIDRAALRREIRQDILAFQKKSKAEQKAILAKYVKSITAERVNADDPGEADYNVTLHVKIDLPTPEDDGVSSGDNSGTQKRLSHSHTGTKNKSLLPAW
jgi:hypothetical protein